jgi:hypothetical protein
MSKLLVLKNNTDYWRSKVIWGYFLHAYAGEGESLARRWYGGWRCPVFEISYVIERLRH